MSMSQSQFIWLLFFCWKLYKYLFIVENFLKSIKTIRSYDIKRLSIEFVVCLTWQLHVSIESLHFHAQFITENVVYNFSIEDKQYTNPIRWSWQFNPQKRTRKNKMPQTQSFIFWYRSKETRYMTQRWIETFGNVI